MDNELDDIKKALTTLGAALTTESEEEWDNVINSTTDRESSNDRSIEIYVRVYGELLITKDSTSVGTTRFLVATYNNIKITIDNSNNHNRPHIHIGVKQANTNEHIPLKNYVRCSECGTPFTGYLVKAKGLYYYKCNKIGCKCNRSAMRMHDLYANLLRAYQIDPESREMLKEQLLLTCEHLTQSGEEIKGVTERNYSCHL